jgi:hypothetical protein
MHTLDEVLEANHDRNADKYIMIDENEALCAISQPCLDFCHFHSLGMLGKHFTMLQLLRGALTSGVHVSALNNFLQDKNAATISIPDFICYKFRRGDETRVPFVCRLFIQRTSDLPKPGKQRHMFVITLENAMDLALLSAAETIHLKREAESAELAEVHRNAGDFQERRHPEQTALNALGLACTFVSEGKRGRAELEGGLIADGRRVANEDLSTNEAAMHAENKGSASSSSKPAAFTDRNEHGQKRQSKYMV